MQNLINVEKEITMSSLDFLNNIINPARVSCGEAEVKNAHFVKRIEDELDDLPAVKTFYRYGNEVRAYDLNMDQLMLVGMRESKAVRRSVLEKLKTLSNPPQMSQAELIAAMAQVNVEQERRLNCVEQKIEQMEQGTIPVGYQGYSYLKATYGLSDAKCRQLVMAWAVPNKKVPHIAPSGQVTQMSVVHEETFKQSLHQMMNEAEQRGTQWYHNKIGRFAISGWENAA
ncbi:hypothetical protein R2242_15765 [Proteus mirabilis]|uniref:Uncharacterized protein n=2 Tax=Proteus mirabilis TaxID=584 RepID=A0AAN1EWE6_PROMI|nr:MULTISPECIES: hypothetical protein [Proteus]ARX35712.1 hypothetical protein AM402_16615 [Proteus mirabilis]AWR60854.1 hypothetical protein CLH65_16460 [Proteus mirabilis]ELB1215747.1 hypothetical protein [Proteus mirabilis]ELO7516161.1 hypothetical protein [Proteus mirabilis]EMB6141169.1 hypothetical protein [Proteus mirabilis]